MHNPQDEKYHQDNKLSRPSTLFGTFDYPLLSENSHRNLAISNQSPLFWSSVFSSNKKVYTIGKSRLTRGI